MKYISLITLMKSCCLTKSLTDWQTGVVVLEISEHFRGLMKYISELHYGKCSFEGFLGGHKQDNNYNFLFYVECKSSLAMFLWSSVFCSINKHNIIL